MRSAPTNLPTTDDFFFGDQFQLITILKVALVRVWAPDLIALDQFFFFLASPVGLSAWIIRDPDGSSRPSGPSRARSGGTGWWLALDACDLIVRMR